MHYVAAEEILAIHSEIIDATGGSHGVRDPHLLASIAEKPKGGFSEKELYKGVFLKASVYLESVANYHVFIDGNKRTAVAVAARFLHMNGYELDASNEDLEDLVLRVATKKTDHDAVALWLKKNSLKT